VIVRHGAYLPHWTKSGAVFAVTFRLADSLPREALDAWRVERDALVRAARAEGRVLTKEEAQCLDALHSERVEKFLDAGTGSCWLKVPQVAQLVADGLRHFDGSRYRLMAWCVM